MDPLWILLVGMIVVMGGILALRLHAFLALVLGALAVGALTPSASLEKYAIETKMPRAEAESFSKKPTIERVTVAFGNTCGKVGILIALATVVGKCLMESGAADRIVRTALRVFGQERAQFAFLGSGFLLGIPIFFDTVFLLMVPLAKAMWMRTKRNYLYYILAIVAGATMTHSLVPPTPGPLFVASQLHVDLGVMILFGCAIGLFSALSGCLYAYWVNGRFDIPVRGSAQTSLAELESLAARPDAQLPSLWLALLPIFLPVLLIGGDTILAGGSFFSSNPRIGLVFSFFGNPNISLAFSCAISIAILSWQKRAGLAKLGDSIQSALADGGLIILITAAGGAFGGVLQQSGIGSRIQELAAAYQIGVLPLAFGVTMLVRIAQGSATVAMITAVGIVGGMASPEQLGFHPVYLALAIGCGSKPIPWMNDSGFWVVCKMSGLTEKEMLKTHSIMLLVMGLTGLAGTMLLSRLLPMV
ncbi:MAG: SLC13 family permease [Verrucomicrobia bacterium]|nr:SLC13 family permease [Verrucomicrobiota bacterium]